MLRFALRVRRALPTMAYNSAMNQAAAAPMRFSRQYSIRKFTRSWYWVDVEDNVAIFGFTNYSSSICDEVELVEYTDVKKVKKNDEVLNLECARLTISAETPVSGTIVQRNEKLIANPSLFHTSPESEAWLCKVMMTVKDLEEAQKDFLDEKEYLTIIRIHEAELLAEMTITAIPRRRHKEREVKMRSEVGFNSRYSNVH